MAEPLSDHERQTTLRVARAMYPHDALPDEAYEKVVHAVEGEAAGSGEVRAAIEQGVGGLDDPTPFVDLDADAPEDGVVNQFGQAHDVPDLFVSDASQFATGAAANPTPTIVALAIRQAEYSTEQLRSGAIPTGHAVWDGRDPGGPAPDADQVAEQPATT